MGQEIMAARYGADFIAAVTRESLAEFEKLIPELPCIGGDRNPLTGNLVFSASALAFYRGMRRCNRTVRFLHSQGADELTPYLCLTDYTLFGALGVELKRTMTLAEGCEKCDFRFKKGESPNRDIAEGEASG